MGRPIGTKNNMRSPEEKEAIVLEYLNDKHPSYRKTAEKYGIAHRRFGIWIKRYREQGIDGLKNHSGIAKNPRKGNRLAHLNLKKNKTREEELELENLKLKVEVARLKKGYQVKGGGSNRNTLLSKT